MIPIRFRVRVLKMHVVVFFFFLANYSNGGFCSRLYAMCRDFWSLLTRMTMINCHLQSATNRCLHHHCQTQNRRRCRFRCPKPQSHDLFRSTCVLAAIFDHVEGNDCVLFCDAAVHQPRCVGAPKDETPSGECLPHVLRNAVAERAVGGATSSFRSAPMNVIASSAIS